MGSRFSKTAVASTVGAAVLFGMLLIPQTSYAATTIQSDRTEAAQISAHITQLNNEVQADANKYYSAEAEITTTNAHIKVEHAKIVAEHRHLSALHKRLQQEAVSVYVQAGSNSQILALVDGGVNSADIVQEDENVVSGDQQGAVSQYQGALTSLAADEHSLEAERTSLQSLTATIASERTEAQAAEKAAQSQLNGVNSQIVTLVAEAQAAALAQREEAAAVAEVAPGAGGNTQLVDYGGYGLPANYTIPVGTTPQASAAIKYALSKLGDPYVWAAVGPNTFDCSGLTAAAWAQGGVQLVPYTVSQEHEGSRVSVSAIVPGDLVLVTGSDSPGPGLPGHVGIYLGDGLVESAVDPKYGVIVQPWNTFVSWGGSLDAVVNPLG